MEKYYDASKIALHRKVIAACENIASNPCSEFGDEVESLLSKVKSLNFSSWQDSATESFNSLKLEIITGLSDIDNSIRNTFFTGETTYKLLKEQLDELRTADSRYENLLRGEPQEKDYQEFVQLYQGQEVYRTSSAFYRDHAEWARQKKTLEDQCKEMLENIKSYEDTLAEINGYSLNENVTIEMYSSLPVTITAYFPVTKSNYQDKYPDMEFSDISQSFKLQNELSLNDNITIGKKSSTVNGVEFEIYYVFDKDYYEENDKFIKFTEESLDYLTRVDSKVLKKIENSGTELFFLQNQKNETTFNGREITYAGLYKPSTKNIYMPYNPPYNSASAIIHEAGHAYDFEEHVTNGFLNLVDKNSFKDLIKKEASDVLNAGSISAYSYDDFLESPAEYFAEAFQQYFLSEEKRKQLSFTAPETYTLIDNLVTNEK